MESNEAKVGMKVEAIESGDWKRGEILRGKVIKVLGPDTVILELEDGRKLKTDVERIRVEEKGKK